MKLKVLLEAEGFEDEEEIEEVDEQPEQEVEEEEVIDDDEPDAGNLKGRKITFPLLFEATYDDSGKAAALSFDEKKDVAQQYADAVVETIEDNKKFIMSALDIYDFECFYDTMDVNGFVTFVVTVDDEVKGDLIINVLKRYFNLQIDDVAIEKDEQNITIFVSAVLDNKYIKII